MEATEQGNKSGILSRANWSALNIVTIILGFIFFWELGVFLLIWAIIGRDVAEIPALIYREVKKLTNWYQKRTVSPSGNKVFDEYQQTQMDRIDEIRKEVSERYDSFRNYKKDRDKVAEKDEFEEFMKKKPDVNGPPSDEQ